MSLAWHRKADSLVTTEGYAITWDSAGQPRYYTAYRPGARSGTYELGAGAGDDGLVKCKQLCERHLERSRQGELQPEVATQVAPQLSNNAVQPTSNNKAAPTSNSDPQSPAQPALF
jgi:hypothetical protein